MTSRENDLLSHLKGAMYNFQKVGVWVQVLSRVALNAKNENLAMGRYFYEIYIFAIFIAVTSSIMCPERTKY